MKKCPSDTNKLQFSEARAKVNQLMKLNKKTYFTTYFNNYRSNAKKTWGGLYSPGTW